MSNKDVIERVSLGYRLPQPPKCPSEQYDLMTQCWNSNAQQRPTFQQILDHFEHIEHL